MSTNWNWVVTIEEPYVTRSLFFETIEDAEDFYYNELEKDDTFFQVDLMTIDYWREIDPERSDRFS